MTPDGNLKSKDGFELTHQINFLSHCLVTYHLLPSMRNAQAPRIINTVSIFHNGGVLDFNNFNDERKVGGGLHGLDY